MSVPFTQYLRPHGEKRATEIVLPCKGAEALAALIIKCGYRFEIEMLTTGEISMEVVRDIPDPDIEDEVAIEICENGPVVPLAVTKMIQDAAATLKIELPTQTPFDNMNKPKST